MKIEQKWFIVVGALMALLPNMKETHPKLYEIICDQKYE